MSWAIFETCYEYLYNIYIILVHKEHHFSHILYLIIKIKNQSICVIKYKVGIIINNALFIIYTLKI